MRDDITPEGVFRAWRKAPAEIEAELSHGFAATASAQFTAFKTNGLPMTSYTMATNGNAPVHYFDIAIATNGVISGSGMRYDVASTSFNATGVSVSVSATGSKLGSPQVKDTNSVIGGAGSYRYTNRTVTVSAPATIILNSPDGTKFKGVASISTNFYSDAYSKSTNVYMSLVGGATRLGRFGFGSASQ